MSTPIKKLAVRMVEELGLPREVCEDPKMDLFYAAEYFLIVTEKPDGAPKIELLEPTHDRGLALKEFIAKYGQEV